jgi:hypothetical protein
LNIACIPLADIFFNQNITEVIQMSLEVGTDHAEKMINNCLEIQIDYLQKCDMKELSRRLNQLSWEYWPETGG